VIFKTSIKEGIRMENKSALSSSTLSNAITENMTATFSEFLSAEPSTTFVVDDVRYAMSPFESAYFNQLLDARFEHSSMADRVSQLVSMFNEHAKPWVWMIFPEHHESGLTSYLSEHGLRKVDTAHGMAMDLSHLSPDFTIPEFLTITRVKSKDELKLWCDVCKLGYPVTDADAEAFLSSFGCVGFDPNAPFQSYVGWVDGKPVATSTGYFAKDGIVGIYCVSTLEEYRGRGIARAMTAFPMLEAKKRGYSGAVLHSTNIGHGVYQNIGFQDYYDIEVWMALPDGETIHF
jgi:predicted GNAT family acetyltransferase